MRVAPKSAGGTYLAEAQIVDVQIAGMTLLLGPLDPEGDGLLDFYFLGPAAAGSYPVTVTVDGIVVPVSLTLEVGGAADAAQTVIDVQAPNPNNSAAEHQLKVLVTPRDAAGNRLGPKADVQIVYVPDPSTPSLLVRDFVPGGQDDGEFPFVLEKPVGSAAATGVLQIHVDGVLLTSVPYTF